MSQKHVKSIISGITMLAFTSMAQASSLLPDAQGMQKIIHKNGTVLSGTYIAPARQEIVGPVSVMNLFSLNTESCGILDFQAGMTGVICINCQQNTAVLKECKIPRTNAGWQLSNG